MDTPLYDMPADSRPAQPAVVVRQAALDRPLAHAILGAAILLGVTADALMHEMYAGVGFGLWIALVALQAVALFWRAGRTPPRETTAWLGAAVLFAFSIAWRNSEALQAFDVLATIGCLGMAALSLRDAGAALFARRMRDTLFTAIDVIVGVAVGVLPLIFRESLIEGQGRRGMGRIQRLARPTLIVLAALVIFGSLLRSADPIFASIVSLPALDTEAIVSHVVLSAFFAWIVAGWARAGLTTNAARHRSPAALPIQLGTADVTAALGTLIVLFGAFIATQLGWLFGGEQFLRARTGLTAAAYARSGFFQMVWVVVLVIPVLVGTRAALQPGPELVRRHTLLSLPVIVLLGAIIASAMLRMKMYVHFYGLTIDRLYPLVFMLWLAVVVTWLAFTVLRNWGRPFVAGTVLTGLATLLALNIADPDVIVARVNIARASAPASDGRRRLDLAHLATLRGGAVELASRALVNDFASSPTNTTEAAVTAASPAEERCTASKRLLNSWGPLSALRFRQEKDGAWRFWNRDDQRAVRAVSQYSGALRAVQHASCPIGKPPATNGNSQT